MTIQARFNGKRQELQTHPPSKKSSKDSHHKDRELRVKIILYDALSPNMNVEGKDEGEGGRTSAMAITQLCTISNYREFCRRSAQKRVK